MSALIKHTICESLGDMQQFKHEWSAIMYRNTEKSNKISKDVPLFAVKSGTSIHQNMRIN